MTSAEKLGVPSENSIVAVPFSIVVDNVELHLALNVHKVLSVREAHNLTPLPQSSLPFIAVYEWDTIPVPVFSLKSVLHEREDAVTSYGTLAKDLNHMRLMICQFQNLIVGMLVDKTRKLRHFQNHEIQPNPQALSESKNSYFNAISKDEFGFIYFLDLEAILAKFSLAHIEDTEQVTQEKVLAGKNILVVEDSNFFLKRSCELLRRYGAKVVSAMNGKEGLELALKNDFDLVFTDIEMPIMNGIEMVSILKRQKPETSVLFNSAISNPAFIHDIKAQDLGEYIVKYEEKVILQKLSEIFQFTY